MEGQIAKRSLAADAVSYKLSNPLAVRMVQARRLSAAESGDEIYHLTLKLEGRAYSFVEGQSMGIVTPGLREDGKPHKLRLYSIASAQHGDIDSDTIGLCVKRLVEHRAEGPYHGICSNYLCNRKPGDELLVTGPVGKAFSLPVDSSFGVLMFATGTGIAPFRAFLESMYPASGAAWGGQAALFYGARTRAELAYLNDENDDIATLARRGRFAVHVALSRQEKTATGERMYVQHRLREAAHDIWPLVKDSKTAIYICGIKGMEHGIAETLAETARSHGADWEQLLEQWKKRGLWNVEVY
ncbi:MAG: hypothetical protein K1X75_00820 [Leptospirales bacterium]|nr:hypothetical protein [Leptospirales bacterium]